MANNMTALRTDNDEKQQQIVALRLEMNESESQLKKQLADASARNVELTARSVEKKHQRVVLLTQYGKQKQQQLSEKHEQITSVTGKTSYSLLLFNRKTCFPFCLITYMLIYSCIRASPDFT
jgi:hypothetical protein